MTLQRIQNQHHPSVPHDRGALKLLALFQTIGQGLGQDFHLSKEPVDYEPVLGCARFDDRD
jgi:hypothetical protein